MTDKERAETISRLEAMRNVSGAFGRRSDNHARDRLLVTAILDLYELLKARGE